MPDPAEKLRNPIEFLAVRKEGRFAEAGPFRVNCRAFSARVEGRAPRRFGIISSKHLVGDAVRRNRAKRVFRELLRTHVDLLPRMCDTSVVIRRSYAKFSHAELSARFAEACGQLARYFEKHPPPPEPAPPAAAAKKAPVA